MQYKIQVNDFESEGNYLKGLASVTFDNAIKVTGIKIGLGKEDSLFIGMPNYKTKDNKYKDICHPVDADFRAELYGHIFDVFDSLHDGKGNILTFNADSREGIEPQVRVTPIEDDRTKGLATIVLNDKFALNNITIKEVSGKIFVDFPAYRTNKFTEDNKRIYQNFYYPISKEWQEKLKSMVLEEYQYQITVNKKKEVPEVSVKKDTKLGKSSDVDKKPEQKKRASKSKSVT